MNSSNACAPHSRDALAKGIHVGTPEGDSLHTAVWLGAGGVLLLPGLGKFGWRGVGAVLA